MLNYYYAMRRDHFNFWTGRAIDLFELTRVIELYKTRTGTVRTGTFHVESGTEEGFAAGP